MPDEDVLIYATPARALPLEGTRAAATRDELMAKALDRAIDPEFLAENPPFFWRAEISNSRLDAYYTVMQDSTLKNFARDAEAGVSFQNSHNIRTLPFGASLAGRFHNGRGDKPAKTEADFYTIPNLRTNEVNTDDLIRGLKAGIVRDVSVGFTGGKTLCSICNRDMEGGWLDYIFGDASADEVCLHFPGETYETKDAEGNKTGEKALCVGRIEDANLVEVSAVYKGATPGAGALKAQRAAEAGKLAPELARRLEQRYRIALPASHRAWAGFTAAPPRPEPAQVDAPAPAAPPAEPTPEPKEKAMPEQIAGDPGTILTPAVREALASMGYEPATDEPQAVELAARQAAEEFGRLRQREMDLAPLADDGKAYRADLIEQAITEGKRAHGTAFPEETHRTLLAHAGIEDIKRVRDAYKATADALVPAGRRTTEATDDQPARTGRSRDELPDAAFRAR